MSDCRLPRNFGSQGRGDQTTDKNHAVRAAYQQTAWSFFRDSYRYASFLCSQTLTQRSHRTLQEAVIARLMHISNCLISDCLSLSCLPPLLLSSGLAVGRASLTFHIHVSGKKLVPSFSSAYSSHQTSDRISNGAVQQLSCPGLAGIVLAPSMTRFQQPRAQFLEHQSADEIKAVVFEPARHGSFDLTSDRNRVGLPWCPIP